MIYTNKVLRYRLIPIAVRLVKLKIVTKSIYYLTLFLENFL